MEEKDSLQRHDFEDCVRIKFEDKFGEHKIVLKNTFDAQIDVEFLGANHLKLQRHCPGPYILANFDEVFACTKFVKDIYQIGVKAAKKEGLIEKETSEETIKSYISKNPLEAKLNAMAYLGLLFVGGQYGKKLAEVSKKGGTFLQESFEDIASKILNQKKPEADNSPTL